MTVIPSCTSKEPSYPSKRRKLKPTLTSFRIAPSAWRLWPDLQATKVLASGASREPSRWAGWYSVATSTTSSASSPCTTMATRMAACSAPRARLSTESRLATSPLERWSTMLFPTPYLATPTAKPSGSFITSLQASRYCLPDVLASKVTGEVSS